VAYIAYHFNWSKREIMEMPHKERRKWIAVIADMNRQVNDSNQRSLQKRLEQLQSGQV
jgi:hypothetical protein